MAGHLIRFPLLLLLCSVAQAQSWQWSPRAPWHAAEVQIVCGGSGTSGMYTVTPGGVTGIVTCAHGFDGPLATVTFSDGSVQQNLRHTRCKYGYDLGFIFCSHPSIKPVTLSSRPPSAGEKVEFVTYGGPRKNTLRHFYGTANGQTSSMLTYYDAFVMSGDSGGTVLNLQGQIIGVQSVGLGQDYAPTIDGKRWNTFKGAGCVPLGAIRDFFGRLRCPDGQCSPQPPGRVFGGRGGIEAYPPAQPQPQPNPPAQPPASGNCQCPDPDGDGFKQCICDAETPGGSVKPVDLDAIAKAIAAALKDPEIKSQLKGDRGPIGPAGPRGPQGPPGDSVDVDALAEAVIQRLPPIKFRKVNDKGEIEQEAVVPLGGILDINHRLIGN